MKTLYEATAEFRKQYILNALMEARGNQCRAAEILGVHRNLLGRVLKENDITMREVRDKWRRSGRVGSVLRIVPRGHAGTVNPGIRRERNGN